jgi:phosphoribosylformimino-5-aminoimidazole carboxamide ribonucleotide (ProFAR) isomerase
MDIMPGTDIRGGKHVRLYQGDHSQETVYHEDPMTAGLTRHSQGHGGSTLQIRMEQLPVSPEVSR